MKIIFLELYNIASNKDALVAKLLLSSEANYHWNIRFTHRFRIGNWSRLHHLWTLFILDLGEAVGWIKFVGNSLLGVFLMFILIVGPYNPQV